MTVACGIFMWLSVGRPCGGVRRDGETEVLAHRNGHNAAQPSGRSGLFIAQATPCQDRAVGFECQAVLISRSNRHDVAEDSTGEGDYAAGGVWKTRRWNARRFAKLV